MKLKDIKQITGQITLLSGLHIGAGDTEMHIGGTDNCVVSHPHTRLPYIPGSSLKGKIRALLEMRSGCMGETEGKPLRFAHLKKFQGQQLVEAEKICSLFGTSGADGEDAQKIGPTRVSFSDCSLTPHWLTRARDLSLTEIKAETAIDRISGTALGGSLRQTERVVAGVSFTFSISIKEMEDDPDFTEMLLEGLKMLELDALGGSGSRGYGRIALSFDNKDIQQTFDTISFS
jgi:CRISPR-associated protein Csm3